MKELLYFLGILAAGALGYKFEPQLRSKLTAAPPATEVIERTVEIAAPGSGAPTGAPAIDLASLAPSQLPEKILLKTVVKVADSASGIVMSIDAGNQVKPVRIEGENVIISPGQSSFVGKVAISDTDLLAQLAAKPPSPVIPAVAPPVVPSPMPEPAVPVAPVTGDSQEPPTQPAPAPTPDPTSTAVVENPPLPEAPPTAAPETPAAPATPTAAGSANVVKTMQDSIKAAQIKEFKFDQVLKWEGSADEIVDGETYQTGLASYKAETIFGVKTIQAKALIKGGKVQRWIWPKSGMEIK